MQNQYDIAIVGAGLVGSSLACALADLPHNVAILDSQSHVTFKSSTRVNQDGRSIALTLSSKKMLDALDLWSELSALAVPIKKIHISDQGRFGATRLDSDRYDVESFGYLVPAEELIRILFEQTKKLKNVDCLQPFKVTQVENSLQGVVIHSEEKSIQAKLLIAADGAQSFIRQSLNITVEEKDYAQIAIVGSVVAEQHHEYTAYERFTNHGPLAILPRANNTCGFIWMNPTEVAENNMTLTDETFMNELQQAFGYRLGHFKQVSKRFAYPLALSVSEKSVQDRIVLIGNAAQTLHPIAGQGLNLALRDIAELCDLLKENSLDDINEALRTYEDKRQPDIENTIRFTDRLNFIFNADYPLLSRSRGLGLALLGAIPILEERIVKQNLGALGSTASLLQEQAL